MGKRTVILPVRKNRPSQEELYAKISDAEKYREQANKACDDLIKQCENDIVIEHIIHNAIMEVCSMKRKSGDALTIFDITPDKRHNVVYELANKVKKLQAELISKRHALEDVNEALKKTRDIIIKEWQKIPEE